MNRDDLIPYLLHQMPDEDRAGLAERCVSDPELFEELRIVEAELLDAYARGELSPEQRLRVETCLLTTPEQRHKLEFAQGLAAAMPRPRAYSLSGIAACIAILALAGAGGWLVRQNVTLRRQVAELRRPAPGTVFVAALPPGAVRGSSDETHIALPPASGAIRLDLELDPGDENAVYAAVVSSAGRNVWSEEPVRPESRGSAFVAPVWIPAGLLQPGEYSVTLSVDGRRVQYYRFALDRAH